MENVRSVAEDQAVPVKIPGFFFRRQHGDERIGLRGERNRRQKTFRGTVKSAQDDVCFLPQAVQEDSQCGMDRRKFFFNYFSHGWNFLKRQRG